MYLCRGQCISNDCIPMQGSYAYHVQGYIPFLNRDPLFTIYKDMFLFLMRIFFAHLLHSLRSINRLQAMSTSVNTFPHLLEHKQISESQ